MAMGTDFHILFNNDLTCILHSDHLAVLGLCKIEAFAPDDAVLMDGAVASDADVLVYDAVWPYRNIVPDDNVSVRDIGQRTDTAIFPDDGFKGSSRIAFIGSQMIMQ